MLQDDRADAFYVVFSGEVGVFISDATKPLKEWKRDVLASRVSLLKKEISSRSTEEGAACGSATRGNAPSGTTWPSKL